jgi:MFS family permease
MFGRVFTLFSVKKAYLTALFLFEIGSLLCGVSRNSITLIIGRAIAGFGSAGILTGSFVVVGTAVPLQSRPMYMAVVGTMQVTPFSPCVSAVDPVKVWRRSHDRSSSWRCVYRSCGMSPLSVDLGEG